MVAALAGRGPQQVQLAARSQLLLIAVLAKTGAGTRLVSETIERTIQRADELSRGPPARSALARRQNAAIGPGQEGSGRFVQEVRRLPARQVRPRERYPSLRDVLFSQLHAKPANDDQQHLWRQLADNEADQPGYLGSRALPAARTRRRRSSG